MKLVRRHYGRVTGKIVKIMCNKHTERDTKNANLCVRKRKDKIGTLCLRTNKENCFNSSCYEQYSSICDIVTLMLTFIRGSHIRYNASADLLLCGRSNNRRLKRN